MTDPLLAPDAAAHVSPTIEQLFAKLGLPLLECLDEPGLAADSRVQAALLGDSIGTLLVLFPRDHLLDLSLLAELTGRRLAAVPPGQLQALLGQQGLTELPGFPVLSGSPCLYDERLLTQPRLLLESGTPGLLLNLSRDDLRSLLHKASAARFAVPQVQANRDRPEQDVAQISLAVETFTARRIRQRLEETIEIPPLNVTAQKIIKLRVNPEASIEDVTDVVETDPALAAQVVSWAASPYYGSPVKIRSVEDAIVRVLGFDLVINLALGLALGKTMVLPQDHPRQTTPYWQQAIYTAAVVEGLTRAMPRHVRPEAGLSYLSGLLHNFGYLVLAHVFPPHFSLLCRHLEVNPHVEHDCVEQHLLGISREQIGGWLMQHWEMPAEVSTALRFQNEPDYDGEHATYANVLCLALRLLRGRGIGAGPRQEIPAALLERLELTSERAEEALQKVMAAEAALRDLSRTFSR